ncbi:MAG: putative sugar nucleotidyl transferase [Nitrososphaerales archaeon]
MHLLIFEDDLTLNFHPITLTRPAFELILGTKALLDGILDEAKPEHYSLLVSEYLLPITAKKHRNAEINPQKIDGDVIFINSLIRLDLPELNSLLKKDGRFVAFSGGNLAIARVGSKLAKEVLIPPGSMAKDFSNKFKGYANELTLSESSLIRYPWQLIELNDQTIKRQLSPSKITPDVGKNVMISGPKSGLILEEGIEIDGHAFFDTREGPIHVGSGSRILPFSRIKGPVYVGRNSAILSAMIGEGTTIGDFVKVGGEVDRTIFAGYSNKAHEGFIGHSYIGEWVNLGAMTTNSDLKDTYGTVKVSVRGERVDSERVKVGSFIADNVKTSIGAYVYTGKKVGVASHIHGYVLDDVPSFTIYSKSIGYRSFEVGIESAIESQRRMMGRRNVQQSKEDKDLLREVFRMTQEERYRMGVIKGNFPS